MFGSFTTYEQARKDVKKASNPENVVLTHRVVTEVKPRTDGNFLTNLFPKVDMTHTAKADYKDSLRYAGTTTPEQYRKNGFQYR